MIFTSPFPDVHLMERPIADEMLELIWRHSSEDPRRNAFIIAETGESITYRQLYLGSLSVASYLREALGFGRGDLACVAMRNCWEYFSLFFGCALCGGGVSGASPLFTDYELHQQFFDSRAKLIVCSTNVLPTVLKAAKNCPNLQKIILVDQGANAGEPPRSNGGPEIIMFNDLLKAQPTFTHVSKDVDLKNDVVLLPYSSGTTGPPKGVMQGNYNYGAALKIGFS